MSDSNITKKALAQSLKELLQKKPLEKISVGDICERCELNRKSFYYHFRDKYDLVEWIFNSEFITTVGDAEIEDRWTFLSVLCGYFYRERDFYVRIFQDMGQNAFIRYLEEYLYRVVETAMRLKLPEMQPEEDYEFCVTYHSGATLMSVVRWLMEGTKAPPEEFVGRLRAMDERMLKSLLEERRNDT